MKSKNVPRLRFPEFRDAPEWEEYRLGDISDVRDGTHDSPKFYSSGKPLITSKNLLNNGTLDIDNVSLISEQDYEQINKRSLVNIGDILFGMIGTIGNPVRVKFDGFAIKNVALIKEKNMLLNEYLVHFLNSQYIAAKFSILNAGNTQKFIALGQIRNLLLPIPKLPEQKKIADCLTSLDDLISAQSAKAEALKKQKKALMQQLFPREGESIPRLRFSEFRNAPAWEEKALEKLLTIGSGKDYKHLSKGDIPVYGSGGYMLSVNDFLYDGESVCIGRKGTIDKPIFLTGKFWTVDTLFYTHSFKDCLPKFIYSCFQNINWQNYNEAGGIPSLSKTTIGKIEIFIPKPDEQQKIADCLTSLDDLIAAQSAKVETLKEHKKALMQQLFPSASSGSTQ